MSEYFVPSHFLQDLQSGAIHDDTLAVDAFDDVDFDALFGDDQFLESPDELPLSQEHMPEGQSNDQVQLPTGVDDLFGDQESLSRSYDAILTSVTSQSDQAKADEPSEDCQSRSDSNEAVNNRDEESSVPKPTSTTNSPNHDQSLEIQNAEEHKYQDDPSEFVEDQGVVSSLHNTILKTQSTNNVQHQSSLPNMDHQDEIGFNDFEQDEEEREIFDELVAYDPFSNSQPGDSLTNNHEALEFQFDVFASKEWQDYANDAANCDLADILGSDAQEEPQMGHQLDRGTRERSQVQNDQQVQPAHSTPQPYINNNTPIQPTPPQGHGREEVPDQVLFETYEENDPLITVDHPIQKGWGRTGKRNGEEVWFNPETGNWQPSATHHNMRATLIARAQAEYPNDSYLHPDETGGLPHGETAFFKPHQNRGPNREDCADELFVWREYMPKKDKCGKPLRKGKPIFTHRDHPGFMFEGGRILLDPHNNPVVDHKFIPLTLSIYTDGSKLQEMALHPGCRQTDLWARLPRWEKKTNKDGEDELIPLRDKNTRINMPMSRFREKKGTLAGGDRDGTAEIMAGLKNFYDYNDFDPVASGNSVKAFPRDLESWEIKAVRLGNAGLFGHRAGHRAVDNAKRAENYQKLKDSIRTGRKKHEAKKGDAGKRRSEDEVAESLRSSSDPQKRRRRGQEVDAGFAAWDRQYAGPQGAPTFEGGHNANGGQSNPHSHQQGGSFQASAPPQTYFNEASESPYQHGHVQPGSMQDRANFNQDCSGIGPSFIPVQNALYQSPYGGLQMQATRIPYESVSSTVPPYNSIANNNYGPRGQYRPSFSGVVDPAYAARLPQGHDFEPVQGNRQTTEHNTPTSNFVPGYHPIGQMNDHYGPPLHRQQPIQGPNGALNSGANSLGPGGRAVHQVLKPKQVLGKRRQQDVGEAESHENGKNGTQQQQLNAQASQDPELGASSKRQRNNGTPGTEPMPQRRHRPDGTSRPRYYGAGGAPEPFVPSDDVFRTSQLSSDFEAPWKSPEKLAREMGGIFGGIDPTAGSDMSVGQAIGPPQSARPQPVMDGREPQQILGKHGRGEPMGQYPEDQYMPQQSLREQDPTERLDAREDETHGPAPKRRFMPRTEGYYAPPIQAPKAQVVKKARKAERDAHLPPPQLHFNGSVVSPYQAPQVEGPPSRPQQQSPLNRAAFNIDEPSHLIGTQRPHRPLASLSAQTVQQTPFDIRDVRPATARHSQSIDDALRYTREAYQEWTGEEAPVTNIEDCYNVQYREILAAFQTWWSSRRNLYRAEPVPRLWRMNPWSGSMEDWKAPENSEHLREVMMRRRSFIPRNEDGSLQETRRGNGPRV